MKKYLFSLGLLFIIQNTVAAEVYTCTVGGKTVYQGKPCAGSRELNSQVKESQKRHSDEKARVAKQQAEWNSKKEPLVGMTTTQVGNSAWGYPQRYSETQTAYGVSEFWHYGSGRMIHFRNGVVVALTK